MTGLSKVAAAAAVLVIGFIPNGDCLKGLAGDTTVLESLPVTLIQTQGHGTFDEVHCRALQLTSALADSETVKLTGSGWTKGPLELLVSQQGRGALDQGGDAAVGIPQVKFSIYPPEQGGEEQEPLAGKTLLTRKESDGKWETEVVDVALPSGNSNLRFSISGEEVRAQKLYTTSGLQYETTGDSLGCQAEDVFADHSASAHSIDEGTEADNPEEKKSVGGFAAAVAQEEKMSDGVFAAPAVQEEEVSDGGSAAAIVQEENLSDGGFAAPAVQEEEVSDGESAAATAQEENMSDGGSSTAAAQEETMSDGGFRAAATQEA